MSIPSMSGMVVCREALAAAAGGQILRRGGNAIDAAIATAFAQGVVNPMACGVGGTAEVNLFLAKSSEHLLVQGLGGAGSLARPNTFEYAGETTRAGRWAVKDNSNYIGYKASTIPTFLGVVGETHRLFGHLPWDQLVEPAIELAAKGFSVSSELASRWDPHAHGATDWPSGMETLQATDACASIYLKAGRFYQASEILVNPDYAETLRRISSDGSSVFYEGEIGRRIADDFAAHGGLFTQQDLLRCRATLSRPLEGSYRGYTLHGSGPIRLEMYNVLERFDLQSLGHNTPRYLDTLARAFQIVHVDRARYSADPRFEDVPVTMLTSKQHAAGLRYLIECGDDIAGVEPGTVPPFGNNTTSVVAMDGEGNAIALTHSNGNCSGVATPGLGFVYNNHMHNFNPKPGYRNSIAPGKNPVGAAGGPLIVCRDGKPFLAIGHHSRAGTTSEVQIVLNMIDFGMQAQEAVSVPRIHAEYQRRTIMADPDFPPGLISGIKALGTQQIIVTPILPAVAAVHRDPQSGKLHAGSDPRGELGVASIP